MHKKNLLVSAIIIFSFLIIYSCGKNPAGPSSPSEPVSTNTFQPTFTHTDTVPPGSTNTFTYTASETYTVPAGSTFTNTPTPSADSYETDNVYTAANEITNGETQTRSIHVWDDEDWMYFNLTEESCVSITTADSNHCYIEVFEEADTVNSSFTSTIGGDGSTPAVILDYCYVPSGKYYIKVRAFNYEPITQYKIAINFAPSITETPTEEETATYTYTTEETATDTYTETPTDTQTNTPTPWPTDVYEDDSTSFNARTIASGSTEYHTLAPSGDEDWFKFTVPFYSSVTLFAQSDDQRYDLRMCLYRDYSGFLSDVICVQGSDFETYIIQPLNAGDYYLKMYDYNTATGVFYNLHYVAVYDTPTITETITPTVTITATVTPTMTLGPDIYEDGDDVYTGATAASSSPNSEIHSVYPASDSDWFVYTVGRTYTSRIYFNVDGSQDDTIGIYVYDTDGAPTSGGYPDNYLNAAWMTGVNDGQPYFDTNLSAGTYYVKIINSWPVYEYSLHHEEMTFTITPTFSITQTFSVTPTITVTSTITTTPGAWAGVAYGTPVISQHAALASNGSGYSWGYTQGASYVHINGTRMNFSADYTKMGKRWLAKSALNDYAVYPFGAGGIYARYSGDSWADYLGITVGNGLQPCIYVDGETPYVAYINSDAGNSVIVKSYTSSWVPYGSANFTPPVSVDAARYNTLSMDGYNDAGTLKLFVAYVDPADGNRVHVKWKNGLSDWENLGSVAYNYAVEASSIDISVINDAAVYVIFTANTYLPVVCRWNGSYWTDLTPSLFACYSKHNSIHAVSENEIYVSFIDTNTKKAIAAMYNGAGWVYMNSTSGYTSPVTEYPYILKSAGGVYSGFIFGGYMGVYKYE